VKKRSYLWAAFMARPFGMPVPANWFMLAAFGLMGAFLSPGFWVLGAGAEVAYLLGLSRNQRFRNTVDAGAHQDDPADQRYRGLLQQLAVLDRKRQEQIEGRAREIMDTLGQSPLLATHADSLEQLVWLHLRLLAARQAIGRVVETARREAVGLTDQERSIQRRMESADLSAELRRSLEQQQGVIDARQAAHAEAQRRAEHVDAELNRIDQQIALIREQALLATDEERIGASLDALAASFNEASKWLSSQRDLLGALDLNDTQRLPHRVLHGTDGARATTEGESA
jgi:hypothetical protein